MGIWNRGLGWFFYMSPIGDCIRRRKRKCWSGRNGNRNGLRVFGREDIVQVNVNFSVMDWTIGNLLWKAGKWLCLPQIFRL